MPITTINTFFFTNSEIIDNSPPNLQDTPLFEGTYLLHLDGRPILTKLEEPELYKVGDTSPNRMVLRKNTVTGYSCILTMEQWEYIRERKGEVRKHTLQDIIDGIPTKESLGKHAHRGVTEHQLFEVQMLRTAKYAMATLIRDKPELVTRERLAQIADKCPFLDPKGAEYIELVDRGVSLARIFAAEGMPTSNSGIRGKPDAAARSFDKPVYDDMQWAMKLVMDTKSIGNVSPDTLTDTDVALAYLRTKMDDGSRSAHTYEHLVEVVKGLSTAEALRCIAAVIAEVTGTPVVDITIGSEMESSGMRWLTLTYAESGEDAPKATPLTDAQVAFKYLRNEMKKNGKPGTKAADMYEHLQEIIEELSTAEALQCIGETLAEVTGTPVTSIKIGSEVDSDGMRSLTLKYADPKAVDDTPSLKVNSADPDMVKAALKAIELTAEAHTDRQVTLATLSKAIDTYISIGQDIDISYQNLLHGDTVPEDEFYTTVAKLYSAMVGLDIEDFIKGKVKDTSK